MVGMLWWLGWVLWWWLNSRWAVVGRLASVGFISVGGLWCGWCAMVARVGFMVEVVAGAVVVCVVVIVVYCS